MAQIILYSHCWKKHVRADGVSCTCILRAGHTELHQWTPDRDFSVSFPPFKPKEIKPKEIKKTTNETADEEDREQG